MTDDINALLSAALPYIEDANYGTTEEAADIAKRLTATGNDLAKQAAPFVADSNYGSERGAAKVVRDIRAVIGETSSYGPTGRRRVRDLQWDYAIPYRHGDGHHYGCGQIVITTSMLDPTGPQRARDAMEAHRKECRTERALATTDHDEAVQKTRAKKGTK